MRSHSRLRGALLGAATLLLLASGSAAQAQSLVRCTEGGRTYYSDKPCPGHGSTRITNFGPQPARPDYSGSSGSSSRLQKAPEHLTHMSAECASLNDAMRTAGARGVGYDTQRDLLDEYRRKCREEDHEARRQVYAEERNRRLEARDQRVAQQQERAQASMTLEQCREMGRIVAERKKRLDSMTAGEKGDFERFQANFSERCRGL